MTSILGQPNDYNITSNSGNAYYNDLKLGTTNNEDLSLITDNIERLRIDDITGKVVISGDLQVDGSFTNPVLDNAILDGGNNTGATLNIGTSDNNIVNLIRDNTSRIELKENDINLSGNIKGQNVIAFAWDSGQVADQPDVTIDAITNSLIISQDQSTNEYFTLADNLSLGDSASMSLIFDKTNITYTDFLGIGSTESNPFHSDPANHLHYFYFNANKDVVTNMPYTTYSEVEWHLSDIFEFKAYYYTDDADTPHVVFMNQNKLLYRVDLTGTASDLWRFFVGYLTEGSVQSITWVSKSSDRVIVDGFNITEFLFNHSQAHSITDELTEQQWTYLKNTDQSLATIDNVNFTQLNADIIKRSSISLNCDTDRITITPNRINVIYPGTLNASITYLEIDNWSFGTRTWIYTEAGNNIEFRIVKASTNLQIAYNDGSHQDWTGDSNYYSMTNLAQAVLVSSFFNNVFTIVDLNTPRHLRDLYQLDFKGATGINQITIPQNLTQALSIQEGANKYLTFNTLDETVIIPKLESNIADFTGANGVNQITIPQNLTQALSIQEGANTYLTFNTLDGSEEVEIEKKLQASGTLGVESQISLYSTGDYTWDATIGHPFTIPEVYKMTRDDTLVASGQAYTAESFDYDGQARIRLHFNSISNASHTHIMFGVVSEDWVNDIGFKLESFNAGTLNPNGYMFAQGEQWNGYNGRGEYYNGSRTTFVQNDPDWNTSPGDSIDMIWDNQTFTMYRNGRLITSRSLPVNSAADPFFVPGAKLKFMIVFPRTMSSAFPMDVDIEKSSKLLIPGNGVFTIRREFETAKFSDDIIRIDTRPDSDISLPILDILGDLTVSGTFSNNISTTTPIVYTPDIDTSSAVSMYIGSLNANKLEVSKSGVDTEIQGNLILREGFALPTTNIDNTDSPYTVGDSDCIVLIDSSSGAVSLTLPDPLSMTQERQYTFKNNQPGILNNITINRSGSSSIDGALSISITAGYQSYTLISDIASNQWFII